MNSIDGVHNGEERFYSVGHFDFIIVDEDHRSVYQKYGAIFQYFDALRLGLTATPKDSADYDTYRLFDEEPGTPTFDYELNEAVKEEFLVPYKAKQVDLGFISRGIRYDELTGEEQQRYELTYLNEYHQKIRKEYLDWAHQSVSDLNRNSFSVKMVMRYVEQFRIRQNWDNLNSENIHNIFVNFASLIYIPEDDEKAKRFDHLMLSFQIAL